MTCALQRQDFTRFKFYYENKQGNWELNHMAGKVQLAHRVVISCKHIEETLT